LEEKLPSILPLAGIKSVSGLGEMEELLMENLKSSKSIEVCVEDRPEGRLRFNEGFSNVCYYSFFVLLKAKINDSKSRREAKENAFANALKIMKQIRIDSADLGETYGFDRDKVSYIAVGPVADNYFGYQFSFLITNEFAL